jgi:hypothetical protein
MGEILADSLRSVLRVEALDMLPRVAFLAVYGISIIAGKLADALDSVRLFLSPLDWGGIVLLGNWGSWEDGHGLARNRDWRRKCVRSVSHHLMIRRHDHGANIIQLGWVAVTSYRRAVEGMTTPRSQRASLIE